MMREKCGGGAGGVMFDFGFRSQQVVFFFVLPNCCTHVIKLCFCLWVCVFFISSRFRWLLICCSPRKSPTESASICSRFYRVEWLIITTLSQSVTFMEGVLCFIFFSLMEGLWRWNSAICLFFVNYSTEVNNGKFSICTAGGVLEFWGNEYNHRSTSFDRSWLFFTK